MTLQKVGPSHFLRVAKPGIVHIDVTHPYCEQLRELLMDVTGSLNRTVHKDGVYVCTEGPRYETPAEIKMFQILGGDLVGMTNVPEVVLAREKGICYAAIAVVTNFAAGISPHPLTHREVLDEMRASHQDLKELLPAGCSRD